MVAARVLTVTVPAEIAEALDESVRNGEFASESEAFSDAVQSWQHKRDLIERQKKTIRHDIEVSLRDTEPSIPIDEVERFMFEAGKIVWDEKA